TDSSSAFLSSERSGPFSLPQDWGRVREEVDAAVLLTIQCSVSASANPLEPRRTPRPRCAAPSSPSRGSPMTYTAAAQRYETMQYRFCGKSGLRLPVLSLGLWHNFGNATPYSVQREMCLTAFDLGITHFDLANNYGPPAGSAEINFGRLMREDF